jgi:hypothetical protein
MATGFVQRFKGKIAAHEIWLARGGLVDKTSGIFADPVVSIKLAMTVTATANTDYAAVSIPAGATLLRATVYTGTAFLAATDAKISIGTSAGDQTYVAQASVKALGVVSLTLVAAAAAALLSVPAAPQLFVRITQTGTTSATGAATLVLEYAP